MPCANASVLNARYRPCSRMAGNAAKRAGESGERGGGDEAEDRVAAEELAHGERADADEGHLRERHLAGVTRQQHQRQHDEPEHDALAEREQVVGRQHDRQDRRRRPGTPRPATATRACDATRGARCVATTRPTRRRAWGRTSSTAYRKMIGSAGLTMLRMFAGQVADRVRLGEAEREATDERERQAPQAADHRRRVTVDDEQRQQDDVERHERRQQDAGETGQRRAERPAHRGDAVGRGAVERGQLGVVDHGAHGGADAGAEQEQAAGRRRRAPPR